MEEDFAHTSLPKKKKVAANYTWRHDEEVAGIAEVAEDVAAADDADNVEHDDEAAWSPGKMIIKLAHKSKTYETRFEFDTISFIWGGAGGQRKQQTPKTFAYATPTHT